MTADELDILREAVRNASDAYREETADMMVRRSQEEVAAAKSRNIKEAATKAGAAAVAALGGFSKSLLSTESGMSKYNAGLNAAGNAAFDIGKQFGVVGFALGGLAKLFTAGMEAVNKQNDAMLKAYDTPGIRIVASNCRQLTPGLEGHFAGRAVPAGCRCTPGHGRAGLTRSTCEPRGILGRGGSAMAMAEKTAIVNLPAKRFNGIHCSR